MKLSDTGLSQSIPPNRTSNPPDEREGSGGSKILLAEGDGVRFGRGTGTQVLHLSRGVPEPTAEGIINHV